MKWSWQSMVRCQQEVVMEMRTEIYGYLTPVGTVSKLHRNLCGMYWGERPGTVRRQ